MKTKFIVSSLVFVVLAGRLFAADGQTNTPFENGLLEEEANHHLDAAIQNYKQAVAYLVTNRQMLATAVFRVGECYRKEGKLGEARIQYRRILRDFPEQTELVRISQQTVGAATNSPPAFVLAFGNSSLDAANNLAFPGFGHPPRSHPEVHRSRRVYHAMGRQGNQCKMTLALAGLAASALRLRGAVP